MSLSLRHYWRALLAGAVLFACHPAAPRHTPTSSEVALPQPVERGPGNYHLASDRLSVEILLRAAGAACASRRQAVDVLKATPARGGKAAFVHYRCGLAADDPYEQLE